MAAEMNLFEFHVLCSQAYVSAPLVLPFPDEVKYKYIYICIFNFSYIYISCKLLNYTNAHMKTILVTDNHLEHQCFQIAQSLILEPPSGEIPSTHRPIPVGYI